MLQLGAIWNITQSLKKKEKSNLQYILELQKETKK